MLIGASAVSLGLSAGGLMMIGPGGAGLLHDVLLFLAVLSTFVMICSAEARIAG